MSELEEFDVIKFSQSSENKKQEMLELSTSIRQDVFKNLGIARLIRFSHPQFADELDEYNDSINESLMGLDFMIESL